MTGEVEILFQPDIMPISVEELNQHDVLAISLIETLSGEQLNFTYSFTDFADNKLSLQLIIATPQNISTHDLKDKLKITVLENKLIRSRTRQPIEFLYEMEADIPQQLSTLLSVQQLDVVASTI